LNEELFAVAPNPAINKTIYLYFKGNTGVAYLYNLQGKLLQAYPIVNGQNILQYSTLDKGIYLIKVNAETSNQTQKIIVL
jgi:Zn/Cd-binding protein ZinT